ncbi:MAG: hypothetical protein II736_08020 [Clostridia bacterium]|nr:hypothetical protein [Clostridia bacterium]
MKKILSVVLAILMLAAVFTLASCGKKKVEPKEAIEAIVEAGKKSTELTSAKGSATAKASIDANVEGQAVKGSADLNADFTVDGLQSGDVGADASLKLNLKLDNDQIKAIIGDGPIEAKIVLQDGVAYIDLKTSSAFIPSSKFKTEIPVGRILGMAGSVNTDDLDTSEAEKFIKKATVSGSGKKTYTLVFDSAKIMQEVAAQDEVQIKSMDDPVVTVTVSKDGYIQAVKFQIKNLNVDAGDEGYAKADVDFTVNLDSPGKDYTVNTNVNPSEYGDIEDVFGGLLGF